MDYAANFAVIADNQLYIQLVEGVTTEALAGWVLATAVLGVLFATGRRYARPGSTC